jgi:hypothetical protein
VEEQHLYQVPKTVEMDYGELGVLDKRDQTFLKFYGTVQDSDCYRLEKLGTNPPPTPIAGGRPFAVRVHSQFASHFLLSGSIPNHNYPLGLRFVS